MSDIDYDAMRAKLTALTVKQLRAIARAEGICLGYDGATKRGTVDAIISERRYRAYVASQEEA